MRSAKSSTGFEECGFVCPSCGFQLRLSEESVSYVIAHSLKPGIDSVDLTCPECDSESTYTRSDLKLFRAGGKLIPFRWMHSASA